MKSLAVELMQECISDCVGDFITEGVSNLRVGRLLQVKSYRCLLNTIRQIYD